MKWVEVPFTEQDTVWTASPLLQTYCPLVTKCINNAPSHFSFNWTSPAVNGCGSPAPTRFPRTLSLRLLLPGEVAFPEPLWLEARHWKSGSLYLPGWATPQIVFTWGCLLSPTTVLGHSFSAAFGEDHVACQVATAADSRGPVPCVRSGGKYAEKEQPRWQNTALKKKIWVLSIFMCPLPHFWRSSCI